MPGFLCVLCQNCQVFVHPWSGMWHLQVHYSWQCWWRKQSTWRHTVCVCAGLEHVRPALDGPVQAAGSLPAQRWAWKIHTAPLQGGLLLLLFYTSPPPPPPQKNKFGAAGAILEPPVHRSVLCQQDTFWTTQPFATKLFFLFSLLFLMLLAVLHFPAWTGRARLFLALLSFCLKCLELAYFKTEPSCASQAHGITWQMWRQEVHCSRQVYYFKCHYACF